MKTANKKDVMNALYEYFNADESLCLLVGDMGFAVLDRFFADFKNRVFNVGIMEQCMVSMAAGMNLCGMTPVVYSQIPFLTMRAFEQIRYDICEHNLNVKLVGIGADNYFNMLGRSHCVDSDDIKIMSIFSNMQILCPSVETVGNDVKTMMAYAGPSYIRCI